MVYDLFILGILIFTTWRGASKGVAWQLAAIAAMVLCFMFATPLSLVVSPMIKLDPPLNRWVAMLVIYLVFCFATFATARAFREALEKAKFQEFDKHLGAVFGLLKGVVLGLVCTFFAVAISQDSREYILTTHTGYASAHIMNAIDPVMPSELHAILDPYLHHLDVLTPEMAADRERRRHGQNGEDHFDDDQGHPLDDGGFSTPDSPSGRPSGYRPTANGTTRPTAPTTPRPAPARDLDEQTIQEVLAGLPRDVSPEVRDQVARALRNTKQENRPRLIDQLKAALPNTIRDLAQSWQSETAPVQVQPTRPPVSTRPTVPQPRPSNAFDDDEIASRRPAPAIDPEQLARARQQFLGEIANVFTSDPEEQARIMTEVESDLLGLPDEIIVRVLADWRADLRGLDPDPDPETSVATQLDTRVLHQMRDTGLGFNRVSAEWQTRLEAIELE